MKMKTKTSPASPRKANLQPRTPPAQADTEFTFGGPAISLATGDFHCAETGEVCGRVWLVTRDLKLGRKHGGVPLPKSLEERCLLYGPLGIITETNVAGASMGADLKDLSSLLHAIRTVDAKQLHAVKGDFAPFYCPKCEKCYAASLWSSMPIYDDGFYDYTEAICREKHVNRILD